MSAPARKTEYLSADPLASAAEAGLRYVSDSSPGIRRLAWGKGFRYVGPDGRTVKEKRELERIRALVIPPAWTNVWICPIADGHLQAVGWDAKGRKQYRYHRLYRAMRDEAKFGRMIAFGTSLAIIRRRIEADLARQGLPREKVLATVVRLLEATSIRVGNDEYAKDNDSFGLTTMRDRHASIEGARLTFRFKGKSGVAHQIELNDSRLARIVKRCQDLPGYELFQYMDSSGEPCRIDSGDVNRYIRDVAGEQFTAKDFRTWSGTVSAVKEFASLGACSSERDGKRKIVEAVKRVASLLGNRPTTCRKYYIHPAIIDAYSRGVLFDVLAAGRDQHAAYGGLGLGPEEYSVMVIVAEYQEKVVAAARKTKPAVRSAA